MAEEEEQEIETCSDICDVEYQKTGDKREYDRCLDFCYQQDYGHPFTCDPDGVIPPFCEDDEVL